MSEIQLIGADWVIDQVEGLTDTIERMKPSEFNEATRYLPESVTSKPGFIRYSVNPFMREIIDCADIDSPVREVNLLKGVQITYSTLLESIAFYYADHIGTLPMMYITADKELAKARIENNFIPMFQQSGRGDIIQSSDEGNTRKTGKNEHQIQFRKGAVLYPFGAKNADKMRTFSIAVMLKDEIDAWPDTVGKDGDPDKLSDDRLSGYWERRKIFRGSTALIKDVSKIWKQYLRGDQRKYLVLCFHCGYPQELRWSGFNEQTGHEYGFKWDFDDDGTLILESVRYVCQNCSHEHFEYDKERLFAEDQGAHWHPTAKPVEPGIRSYHLPALYSPVGMQPWYKSVMTYLDGYDPIERKVTDIGKYQVFYNNVLAMPFEIPGAKVTFMQVSSHRRPEYRLGEIPNNHAILCTGGRILFLTLNIDVQKSFLAVSVFGWCRDAVCYLIDNFRLEDVDCTLISSPVWGQVRELIEEKEYTALDGRKYRIYSTAIDAGYANDTVSDFCGQYSSNVWPTLGRDRPGKTQKIQEFAEFKTQAGTVGYRITVDHYKDRLAPVLRREWDSINGLQKPYHFNAPVDLPDKYLKELTVETRRKKVDDKGTVSYYWHRPGNARNELWDTLNQGHALVEIIAYRICIEHFELETVDWPRFWDYIEQGTN